MRWRWARRLRAGAAAALLLAPWGCVGIGPKTIPRDQFDYGGAVADAGKQILLLNMVKLRYLETPQFVEVASIINQYELAGQVEAGLGFGTAFDGSSNTQSLGGAGRWADRPTITYNPVRGQQFARSLLTPLPPEALFALVQSGWAPETILRLTVKSMNHMDNERMAAMTYRPADPRFLELLRAWGRLRDARVIGLRREGTQGGPRILLYRVPGTLEESTRRDMDFLYEALELPRDVNEFELTYGLVPQRPNEIAVLTMSVLEIMLGLSFHIDVPPEHVAEGRTVPSVPDLDPQAPPLFRVSWSSEPPADSYAAVRNRGYWFSIDDRDLVSKRTFAIVQLLLSLTDTGEAARGPVLSIGN